jgi:hypothetical protein
MLIPWPAHAEQDKRNAILIEQELSRVIRQSQVTLLGEIDLDARQSYAGANFSLRELAAFAFSTGSIKGALSKWTVGNCHHPAIVAIWSVAQAQNLEDGTELWTTSNLEGSALVHLPSAFSESIATLGLETFEDQLDGMQRHMTLARLHAVIPTYALGKFVSHIKRGSSYHLSPRIILHEIRIAQDMSRAVQKLFEEKPELGLDLISRAVDTFRTGQEAGLPPRLHNALSKREQGILRDDIAPVLEIPQVALDESRGELYIRGATNWELLNSEGASVNRDCLPTGIVIARNQNFHNLKILDASQGYLVFNLNHELVENSSVPMSGGILIFDDSVRVDVDAFATESIDFFSWQGWKLAYLKPGSKLQITLANGAIRSLSSRQILEVINNSSRYLETKKEYPILFDKPRIAAGQIVTVIDHISNNRTSFGPEETAITEVESGPIHLTVYAGLGKTLEIKGLLIPGLKLNGNMSPLLKNESRDLKLEIATGWEVPSHVVIVNNETFKRQAFNVSDKAGKEFEIFIDLPKLYWSIEFENETPELYDVFAKFKVSRIKEIRRIVLHGLGEQQPRMLFKQGSKQTVLNGKLRNQDCLYDVQIVQDATQAQSGSFLINLGGVEIALANFLLNPEIPKKEKMRSVSLDALDVEALAKGIISEKDWNSFKEEQKYNSIKLRDYFREKRR